MAAIARKTWVFDYVYDWCTFQFFEENGELIAKISGLSKHSFFSQEVYKVDLHNEYSSLIPPKSRQSADKAVKWLLDNGFVPEEKDAKIVFSLPCRSHMEQCSSFSSEEEELKRALKEDGLELIQSFCIRLALDRLTNVDIMKFKSELVIKSRHFHNDESDYKKAKVFYRNSLLLCRKLYGETSFEVAEELHAFACFFKDYGKYQDAKEMHEESLDIRRNLALELLGYQSFSGHSNFEINSLLQKVSENQKAQKALTLRCTFVESLQGLANAYSYMGESSIAKERYEEALEIFKTIRNDNPGPYTDYHLGIILGNQANLLKRVGTYEEAKAKLEEALPLIEAYKDKDTVALRNYATYLTNFSQLLVEMDRCQEAFDQCWKALEIRKSLFGEKHRDTVTSFCAVAFIYLLLKDPENANQEIAKALEGIDSLDDPAIEAIVRLNAGKIYLEQELYEEAAKELKLSIDASSKIRNELNSKQQMIRIYEQQVDARFVLERALLKQGRYEEALVASDGRRAIVLEKTLVTNLQESTPIITPQPLELSPSMSVDEIQELAKQQQSTFVVYSTSPLRMKKKELEVWVISPEGKIHPSKPLPIESLAEDIEGFDSLLEDFPFERARSLNLSISVIENLSFRGDDDYDKWLVRTSFIEERLAPWYQELIAPIEHLLPKDPEQTVTIVPDGFLSQLPFAAFRGKDQKFLIQKHPISIAPSMRTLHILDKIRTRREIRDSKESLIIGNPIVPGFKDLEEVAQEEAVDVGKLLDVKKENILLKETATVSSFLEKASTARFIFAACHGESDCKPESDPHSVFEGHLKLTKDERYPNGNLHSQQISTLNLVSELVFLSACHSGTGRIQQEGTIGNVWSFLAAGSLSTVTTYWKVPETETTRQMVNCFFHHMLGARGASKLNKARALQKAILLGIEKEPVHFNQWGAFYLSGLN